MQTELWLIFSLLLLCLCHVMAAENVHALAQLKALMF